MNKQKHKVLWGKSQSSGKYYTAEEYASVGDGGPIICDVCQKELGIRKNKMQYFYFYHINHQKKQSHDFSEHQQLQNKIAKSFGTEVQVYQEETLDKHRADVVAYYKKMKFIFEIQRTSISLQAINSRVHTYQKLGYRLFWVLIIDEISELVFVSKMKKWWQYLISANQEIIFYSKSNGHFFYLLNQSRVASQKLLVHCKKVQIENMLEKTIFCKRIPRKFYSLYYQYFAKWERQYNFYRSFDDELANELYRKKRKKVIMPAILSPAFNACYFNAHPFWLQSLISLYFQRGLSVDHIYQLLVKKKIVLFDDARKVKKELLKIKNALK